MVLSACETGLTDPSQLTDEYIGLPSGFLYSGASTVVSSLWRVSDLATALLMIRFYQLRFDPNNPLSTAQALQHAQTWLCTSTAQQLQLWLQNAPLESQKKNEIIDFLSYACLDEEIPFAAPQYWAAFCSIGL